MSVRSGQSIAVLFTTRVFSTGVGTNADSLPIGTLYLNGTANGASVTVTNVSTGLYKAAVTLPTLAVNDEVELIIAATVSSVADTAVIWGDTKDLFAGCIPDVVAGGAGGLFISGANTGPMSVSNGVTFTGAAAVGGTPATDGLKLIGGAASTTGGGAAGRGLYTVGGAGAASTNGAAAGTRFEGGGTTTVTGGRGLHLVGTGTLADFDTATNGFNSAAITATTLATSGATTLNSFVCTNNFTVSGNWLTSGTTTLTGAVSLGSTLGVTGATTLTGLTTGALSCSTITASGAVALQSTLAVTGTTTLTGNVSLGGTLGVTGLTTLGGLTTGALSCSTITASGAVALQSTLAVTGTTTLTGAVSLGSTLGVTGTTTLAAVNTGAMTHTSFTCTNDFTVSGNWLTTGTTTWTGAASLGSTLSITGNLTAANLTNARIGYLDNLNVGGAVASHADILAINQSASKHILLQTVGQYEPGETYTVEMRTFNASTGAAVNADSTPTLTATGNVSGDLSANLSAATNPATGVYRWTYTPGASPTLEQIRMDGSATISASTFTLSAYTQTVDFATAVFTATDQAHLTSIFNKLPANNIADETLLLAAVGSPQQVGTKYAVTLAATDVTGNVAADLQTIRTQTVTCAAGVTIRADLGAAAAPGAANGMLIGGSNAATTFNGLTTGALSATTISASGAVTVTGNMSLAAGLTITQSTTNADAVSITGNGTGHGMHTVGGTTGDGWRSSGGASGGTGFYSIGVAGPGMRALGGTNQIGFLMQGNGSGAGSRSQGGGTGNGWEGLGGSTSGNAFDLSCTSGDGFHSAGAGTNGNGMNLLGSGSGSGVQTTGGPTGNGQSNSGGNVSGDGFSCYSQAGGRGARFSGGTGLAGILVIGDINAGTLTTTGAVTFNSLAVTTTTALTGAVTATNAGNDIRGVTTSAGTVTNVTGDVQGKVLGGGASTITAAGVWALDGAGNAVAPAATALSTANWTNVRAGHLDNLNVGGAVASHADALALSTQIGTPQQAGSAVTLPGIPNNWITASGIAAGALNGKGDWLLTSGYTAPDNADIALIKAQTDKLSFTVANKVDSNVKYVNDVQVKGTGAVGNEWGPV